MSLSGRMALSRPAAHRHAFTTIRRKPGVQQVFRGAVRGREDSTRPPGGAGVAAIPGDRLFLLVGGRGRVGCHPVQDPPFRQDTAAVDGRSGVSARLNPDVLDAAKDRVSGLIRLEHQQRSSARDWCRSGTPRFRRGSAGRNRRDTRPLFCQSNFTNFASGTLDLKRMRRGAKSDHRPAAIQVVGDVLHFLIVREILEAQER